jgi:hypothetical protein
MTVHKQQQIFAKWVQDGKALCAHRFTEQLDHPGANRIMVCRHCGRDAETPVTMDDIPVVEH